ncbi:MAG: hypothetical protein WA637_05895 [Terriglobales bacterium]
MTGRIQIQHSAGKEREVIMRELFLALVLFSLAVLSSPSTSRAQISPQPSASQGKDAPARNSAPEPDALPPGTVLSVELSKSLDARKSKADAKVEARTAIDLLVHGQIVVPRNTKVIGHVTEAKAHSKTSPGSLLGITFERMLLKGGREVPLQATVQAIARPLQLNNFGNEPIGDMASGMPGQRPASAGDSTPPTIPPKYPPPAISEPPGLNVPDTSTVSPLAPTSRGVVGIKGLSLETSGSVSVLTSHTGNVHLDSGTQLMLRVQ